MALRPPMLLALGEGAEPAGGKPDQAIGHDEGTYFVLGPEGQVLSTDPAGQLPTRFVNSDARRFRDSLDVFKPVWGRLSTLDDAGAVEAAQRLLDDLKSIDASALDHPENYWPVIVEQIRDGVL